MHYLNDGTGELILNGFKYQVVDWDNGYNGCENPTQFFTVYQGGSGGGTVTDDLTATIKAEVAVENTLTDPSIIKVYSQLIANQLKKLLGW